MRVFTLLAAVLFLLGSSAFNSARERLTPGSYSQLRSPLASQGAAVRSLGHSNLDVERMGFACFIDVMQALVTGQHPIQAVVIMPDNPQEQQAHQPKTEPDLFPDSQFAE